MADATTSATPHFHQHTPHVENNWLWEQNAPAFEMVEVSAPDDVSQETFNQEETFSAFTTCQETCRIFVSDVAANRIYELRAPSFLASRPFSDLVWVSGGVLTFDQWTQPHHSVHYAVDVPRQELVLASPFPDSW